MVRRRTAKGLKLGEAVVRLQTDRGRGQIGSVGQQLRAGEFLGEHNLLLLPQSNQMKGVPRQVDAVDAICIDDAPDLNCQANMLLGGRTISLIVFTHKRWACESTGRIEGPTVKEPD